MSMSAARFREILNGQTAIARKVFEATPIAEAWAAFEIQTVMQRTTLTRMDLRTFQGCLKSLRESGLITEPRAGYFQRVTPKEEKRMSYQPEKTAQAMPPPPGPKTAQDGTGGLLAELSARGRKLAQSINEFADDIDAAAAVIVEEAASNAESLRKLNQLQSLLKSLS
jgi:hypothetical protein